MIEWNFFRVNCLERIRIIIIIPVRKSELKLSGMKIRIKIFRKESEN
jgi:hypothetical protein